MGTQRDVCSEEKGVKRQVESLPTSPEAGDGVLGGAGGSGAGTSRRTLFPPLSRFLGSPSLPSFCLKQIKMAELSSLEENMEVIMEAQLNLTRSSTFPAAGQARRRYTHSRDSISRGERRQKNRRHFISVPLTVAAPC